MDAGLARALERIVGERGVVVDRARRSVYECDALAFQRRAPDLHPKTLLRRHDDLALGLVADLVLDLEDHLDGLLVQRQGKGEAPVRPQA